MAFGHASEEVLNSDQDEKNKICDDLSYILLLIGDKILYCMVGHLILLVCDYSLRDDVIE